MYRFLISLKNRFHQKPTNSLSKLMKIETLDIPDVFLLWYKFHIHIIMLRHLKCSFVHFEKVQISILHYLSLKFL